MPYAPSEECKKHNQNSQKEPQLTALYTAKPRIATKEQGKTKKRSKSSPPRATLKTKRTSTKSQRKKRKNLRLKVEGDGGDGGRGRA